MARAWRQTRHLAIWAARVMGGVALGYVVGVLQYIEVEPGLTKDPPGMTWYLALIIGLVAMNVISRIKHWKLTGLMLIISYIVTALTSATIRGLAGQEFQMSVALVTIIAVVLCIALVLSRISWRIAGRQVH